MKSAIPDEPQQAAKDAASSAKDSLPEAPSNPFQGFFSGKPNPPSAHIYWSMWVIGMVSRKVKKGGCVASNVGHEV